MHAAALFLCFIAAAAVNCTTYTKSHKSGNLATSEVGKMLIFVDTHEEVCDTGKVCEMSFGTVHFTAPAEATGVLHFSWSKCTGKNEHCQMKLGQDPFGGEKGITANLTSLSCNEVATPVQIAENAAKAKLTPDEFAALSLSAASLTVPNMISVLLATYAAWGIH
jgi:hypothetical protein